MIRYNFHRDESGAYMVEDADGEYVRYAEVHPLVDGDLATQRAICDGLLGPNDRQDAERYRVLRDDGDTPVWVSERNEWGRSAPCDGARLDEVLDQYIAERSHATGMP